MRRLLMLPLLFAVTIGNMLNASADENQSNEPAEIRMTECRFAGQANSNITFTCVLTNTTAHPVEVALYASRYKFLLSTLTGEWLGYSISQSATFGHGRLERPSLTIPAYESRVHEKVVREFFDKWHQGDVRLEVVISPCPCFFPKNSLPGVMLFNKDLKFDEIMEASQTGDFLSIKPK